ncbi:hypothetical protein Tco_1557928, partial [Tanacetum coccineum]
IFSRLNPGEKLVVGCRKAAVAADAQLEGKTPAANGVAGGNGNLSPVTLDWQKKVDLLDPPLD